MEITRTIVLDAERDDVWEALVDPEARSGWLEDDRPIEILTARPGEQLTWRWDEPGAGQTSTVVIRLEETDDDRTILTVTEHRAASASCSLAEAVVEVDVWDRRLLGLELRCLGSARAGVLVTA
jgi:uncharacterized protein YndB with AHSA1/START domain